MPTSLGFLGPQGSFTEEAALTLPAPRRLVPYADIAAALEAFAEGFVDEALVPVENSIEGGVNVTLDFLAEERPESRPWQVIGEVVLPIRQHLAVRPDAQAPIQRILSHPQALGQCRKTLQREFPQAILEAVGSTALAGEMVQKGAPGLAAVLSIRGVERFGLRVVRADCQDFDHNSTRFFWLGSESPAPSGQDRTSVVFSLPDDQPGGLYHALSYFAVRRLNLTRVETRPAKTRLGLYYFFLDVVGHQHEVHLAEALQELQSQCQFFRILGSYPMARQA